MKVKGTDIDIISSGSKGNAVVIGSEILIDCGVPYSKLKPHKDKLKVVLLTHEHSDHFNKFTIKKLAQERPKLRFVCGPFLAHKLLEYKVSPANIDVVWEERPIHYENWLRISCIYTRHNVPNLAYLFQYRGLQAMYATDANNLNGIEAKNFDLYMIEANYDEDEIQERIKRKLEKEEYSYELEVIRNHLSRQKCDAFLANNAGPESVYIYMHQHEEHERKEKV